MLRPNRNNYLVAVVASERSRGELAGGDVGEGEAKLLTSGDDGHEVVVTVRAQHAVLNPGPGSDDLGDLPLDEASAWFADLIADGYFVAGVEETGGVDIGGVMGDAAHGHLGAFAHFPAGKDDLQDLGREDGVVVEHFVEITEPEENDGVGIAFLDLEVLTPNGGRGGQMYTGFRIRRWAGLCRYQFK
jgi:hypothetical protein